MTEERVIASAMGTYCRWTRVCDAIASRKTQNEFSIAGSAEGAAEDAKSHTFCVAGSAADTKVSFCIIGGPGKSWTM